MRAGPIEYEIIVRIFANISGLESALSQRGLISFHGAELKDFTVGLTQSCNLVDFIDVGLAKEMADSKINGRLCSLAHTIPDHYM